MRNNDYWSISMEVSKDNEFLPYEALALSRLSVRGIVPPANETLLKIILKDINEQQTDCKALLKAS